PTQKTSMHYQFCVLPKLVRNLQSVSSEPGTQKCGQGNSHETRSKGNGYDEKSEDNNSGGSRFFDHSAGRSCFFVESEGSARCGPLHASVQRIRRDDSATE